MPQLLLNQRKKKAPGSERVLGGLRTRATFPGAWFRAGNNSIRVHHPHESTSFLAWQLHIRALMRSRDFPFLLNDIAITSKRKIQLSGFVFVFERSDSTWSPFITATAVR